MIQVAGLNYTLKITVKYHKNFTEPLRSEHGIKKDANKLSTNPSNSKNNLQEKISDSTIVVEQNTDKAVLYRIQEVFLSQHFKVLDQKQLMNLFYKYFSALDAHNSVLYVSHMQLRIY